MCPPPHSADNDIACRCFWCLDGDFVALHLPHNRKVSSLDHYTYTPLSVRSPVCMSFSQHLSLCLFKHLQSLLLMTIIICGPHLVHSVQKTLQQLIAPYDNNYHPYVPYLVIRSKCSLRALIRLSRSNSTTES